MEELQYPIGRFSAEKELAPTKRQNLIREIAGLPARLRKSVEGLSAAQLDTPYRNGGWTPRQIVHHVADSHMNAFIRFKLALTEDNPQIKPFEQDGWAAMVDSTRADPALSLAIVDGLHARFSALLSSLSPEDFARTFQHPERGVISLDYNLQLYAWHGNHHTAHIEGLRARKGWK
jgi:hypothetical protein